jgi:hypothetical protein
LIDRIERRRDDQETLEGAVADRVPGPSECSLQPGERWNGLADRASAWNERAGRDQGRLARAPGAP